MKALIPENLACIYHLTVPFAFDVRKVRRQLDAELEKLHPCFPEQCAVDYRLCLRLYGRSPDCLHVRAVVMDRLTLAAIRRENERSTLYLDGGHPYPVFSDGILKKRMLLIAAGLLLAVLALCAVHAGRAGALPEAYAEPVPAVEEAAVPAVVMTDFSGFITRLYDCGGTITRFSWNAAQASLSLLVTGLYPEQAEAGAEGFGAVTCGQVSYSDAVPSLEITLALVSGRQLSASRQQDGSEKAREGVAAVRQLVLDYAGTLVSETVSPPALSGSVPEASWGSFAEAFMTLLCGAAEDAEPAAALSALELRRDGETVVFSCAFGDVLLPFSDIACVFSDAPGLPHFHEEPVVAEPVSKQKEIGRITREDGSYVIFIHNEEGKIERRVYEE